MQPATGTGMSDTGNGPQGGANHKAELQADDVDKPAAQRLEKGGGPLKSADDPRILFVVMPSETFSSGAIIPRELRVM